MGVGDVEGFGDEAALAGEAALGELLIKLFVNDAFVEGVLVDDYEALFGLSNEVSVVNLEETLRGGRRR